MAKHTAAAASSNNYAKYMVMAFAALQSFAGTGKSYKMPKVTVQKPAYSCRY